MKKNYFLHILCFLLIPGLYAQEDCNLQRTVSDPVICNGGTAEIILTGSVSGSVYKLRIGTADVAGQSVTGTGGDLSFFVSPAATTSYNVYVEECGSSYTDLALVTVNQIPDVAASSNFQTSCSGNTITPITFSGSLAGTTYNWTRDNTVDVTGTIGSSGSGTISGTLINNTTNTATVVFTITPTKNGCDGTPITVNIIVEPNATGSTSLSSQTICANDNITPITFTPTIPGTVFNWAITTLPAGVGGTIVTTGSGSGTISGTLTNSNSSARTIIITVTPEINGCPGTSFTVSVIINPRPNATASAPNQTKCSGVGLSTFGISPATYTWTRDNQINVSGFTNGSNSTNPLTGLGLTNNTSSPQTVTFTVTPFIAATGCTGNPINVTAVINPTPDVTANLMTQSVCEGNNISDIILSSSVSGTTYSWTRTETIDITGIPDTGNGNITGAPINNTNSPQTTRIRITPSANGCTGPYIDVFITVNPTPTTTTTVASQTKCTGVAITPIPFTQTVVGTSFNWVRDNTTLVTGMPNNGSLPNTTSTINGTLINNTATAQTVIFTITPIANGCPGTPITSTVIVEPVSLGGTVSTVTAQACHNATGTLTLSGYRGNIVKWQRSIDGGTTWPAALEIANITSSCNYNETQTTLFRAVVQNSTCSIAYSTVSRIIVIPDIAPNPVTASPSTICNGDTAVLTAYSSYATSSSLATGGAFNTANPTGWQVDSCGNCLSAGASNTDPGPWQLSATNGGTYSGITYQSTGKFAIVHGAFNSYLYTPTFNTFGLTSATLTFTHSFHLLAGATASIQISVNGGAYTTLQQYTGPLDYGNPIGFSPGSVDLSNYIGYQNLRIRFYFQGNNGSSWAVDNIGIPETPTAGITTEWVDANGNSFPPDTSVNGVTTLNVSPTTTTIYRVRSYINGCLSNQTTSVTVTVNQRPTGVIGSNQTVCNGGTATFSIALTGSAPWRITYSNGTTSTTVNNVNTNPYVFSVTNVTTNRTYTITALNDSKCNAIASDFSGSATVSVLNGTKGLWTGFASTDWFDCLNWAGGLPDATTDATIPNSAPRMPVIDPASPKAPVGGIAIARDLIVSSGASVTMTSLNSKLHIKRDWKNSGSFIPGLGTVTFNGGAGNQIQLINFGIKLNESFYNLSLENTGTAKGVSVEDGFQLTVTNNLVLTSGNLRLVGDAQLVQNGTQPNPAGGTGNLLRDQQGTKSSYHYNIWSSPVSANNTSYTVGGVLRDGTNAAANPFAPGTINFGDGVYFADGPLSSPIKISNSWIYKYTLVSTNYSSWQLLGSTGTLNVGEGFTMKGVTNTAAITDLQNYVFVGKPNNGNFNLSMADNQLYMIGNPYPSALNAEQFITDNLGSFNGALYFWDHFGGTSHYLSQYVAGYATYSLAGGVAAISDDPMINNNNAMGTKVPTKYVPVGQGFFIRTDIAGPTGNNPNQATPQPVAFKNSQRAFAKEASGQSVFIRSANSQMTQNDDLRQKIRLGFTTSTGIRRQLLLTADSRTSNAFDKGYDAPMIENNPSDMFWELDNFKLVIQAVKDFNLEQEIPLGVKTEQAGLNKIKIDALENFSDNTEIYLFDNLNNSYHNIKAQDFNIELAAGEYNHRFSLRFTNETLSTNEASLNNGILIYTDKDNILTIQNNTLDSRAETVVLYNILGQSVGKWEVTDQQQQNIQIPVEHVRSGAYIVKLKTSTGSLSKKIIIQ
ncbi:T9SS type A sorting domain-containing protein [Flavobacterium sp. SM15]|uniref:PKD-like domain-containing protein n=1 Tax=Flavobacterium sp. SM15 TaxID=2908005 RepID=UPI001EDA3D51|nr:PKD-like domain-containing protein [Flavobacterium sp. SM15]MCG2610543.1 T9SS type A sorting domain-containing protein [Flavobacterium sp. SM15]